MPYRPGTPVTADEMTKLAEGAAERKGAEQLRVTYDTIVKAAEDGASHAEVDWQIDERSSRTLHNQGFQLQLTVAPGNRYKTVIRWGAAIDRKEWQRTCRRYAREHDRAVRAAQANPSRPLTSQAE